MLFLKYSVIIVCVLCFLVALIMAARQKKICKYILFNAFLNVLIFLIIYFLKGFVHIELPLNLYTIVGVLVFGVPAIIGFLVLNLII